MKANTITPRSPRSNVIYSVALGLLVAASADLLVVASQNASATATPAKTESASVQTPQVVASLASSDSR